METKFKTAILLLLVMCGCKKEQNENTSLKATNQIVGNLSLEEARDYLNQIDPDSAKTFQKMKVDWTLAINKNNRKSDAWHILLPGQPTYQSYKQGYRELIIKRNRKTAHIEARITETIPDALYLQENRISKTTTFTGRVFHYNLNYKLINGQIYSNGKQVGEIRQLSKKELLDQMNSILGQHTSTSLSPIQGKLMKAMVIESCTWVQNSYVDANGDLTIHSERICNYTVYDDGVGGNGSYEGTGGGDSGTSGSGGGGGGSTGTASPPPPPPSNLPGENNSKVDPKKMMDCFSAITDPNAAFVVRVYVIEPQPGTFFNVGQNAFGHVAISLSKTSGNNTITQTIGFYPTGTGLEKLNSKSQILDNSFVEYNMSATYYVTNESFQKVINYVSNPPTQYHFTDYNCSAFVFGAGQAGGLPIPDPITQVGIGGPGGASFARTPAGMASALRAQKAATPNADINEGGGRIPASKGPCN